MTMTWKNGRQLATLQDSDDTIIYEYDSNSVRIKKTVDGVEHTYAYLGGKLMYETRGEAKFYYSYDANGYLYNVKYTLTDDSERKSYFFTHNSFGDIIGIYSGSGVLTAQYEYDAWGKVISITDGNGNEITDTNNIGLLNPFRYRGYYYDSETGLYYLMSRYYDPVTRRFINADNCFQSGNDILDTNAFAYCGNCPINRVDYTGESWLGIALTCFAVAAVCVAAVAFAPAVAVAAAGVGIATTTSAVITASIAVGTIATGAGIYASAKHASQAKSTISSSKSYDVLPRNHTVYGLVDSNGNTQYIGRTTNPERRQASHANNSYRSHLTFVPIATGLNAIEARGVEQIQMMYHHTINTSNKMNNQINGISPFNPNLPMYMAAGRGALSYLENKISNEILYWTGN